jgi:hypothetical protein
MHHAARACRQEVAAVVRANLNDVPVGPGHARSPTFRYSAITVCRVMCGSVKTSCTSTAFVEKLQTTAPSAPA